MDWSAATAGIGGVVVSSAGLVHGPPLEIRNRTML